MKTIQYFAEVVKISNITYDKKKKIDLGKLLGQKLSLREYAP